MGHLHPKDRPRLQELLRNRSVRETSAERRSVITSRKLLRCLVGVCQPGEDLVKVLVGTRGGRIRQDLGRAIVVVHVSDA